MRQVVWTAQALRDLASLRESISRDRPADAERQVELILTVVERLARFPDSGRPSRGAGTRELVIRQTPYVVPLIRDEIIEVLAVLHGLQRWPEAL
jgi:addiction module RelE/StbE family toxin